MAGDGLRKFNPLVRLEMTMKPKQMIELFRSIDDLTKEKRNDIADYLYLTFDYDEKCDPDGGIEYDVGYDSSIDNGCVIGSGGSCPDSF